jgi:hypothetical protein
MNTLFPMGLQSDGLVECLGVTFANDAERRAYFIERLHEKLRDPEFRTIEGFPIGSDEDILALSDPPYYTACPNPFIEDFIRIYGRPYDPDKAYRREPLAIDVSEGKTDPMPPTRIIPRCPIEQSCALFFITPSLMTSCSMASPDRE